MKLLLVLVAFVAVFSHSTEGFGKKIINSDEGIDLTSFKCRYTLSKRNELLKSVKERLAQLHLLCSLTADTVSITSTKMLSVVLKEINQTRSELKHVFLGLSTVVKQSVLYRSRNRTVKGLTSNQTVYDVERYRFSVKEVSVIKEAKSVAGVIRSYDRIYNDFVRWWCSHGWSVIDGRYCMRKVTKYRRMSWSKAKQICEDSNGKIFSPKTAADFAALRTFEFSEGSWIDLSGLCKNMELYSQGKISLTPPFYHNRKRLCDNRRCPFVTAGRNVDTVPCNMSHRYSTYYKKSAVCARPKLQ